MEDRREARGRTARRITRLEQTLGQTRAQLERSRSRRDELESLLQRMVDRESTRQDDLEAREQDLERERAKSEALRQELEERAALAERERLEAEQREREASEELESVRAELERRKSEYGADQGRRADELSELRERAAREEQLRGELEARLEEARRRAGEAVEQLQAQRERRGELEDAYRELHDDAEQARAQADEERRRAEKLGVAVRRLEAEVEQARRDAEDEHQWNSELEARLAKMEKHAELVLQGIDEELEISLGRAALERERRAAVEARLAETTEAEQPLRAEVERLRRELEGAPGRELSSDGDALAEAEREIRELRVALEDARSASETGPHPPATAEDEGVDAEPYAEIDRLRAEQEQSRRRILQLESELGEARDRVTQELEQPTTPLEALTEAERGRRPDKSSRAPVRDPSELASLDDEELAETFDSMREAARLADDRGDRDSAKSHRALARAAAREAANRQDFGEAQQGQGVLTRVRGRRRSRILRELGAARERVLEQREGVFSTVGEEEEPAGGEEQRTD